MSITERDDVELVVINAPDDGDGGDSFIVGGSGVTAIKIVARHGPMDWIPYVEVWLGDQLHVEAAQHQCSFVRFKYKRDFSGVEG